MNPISSLPLSTRFCGALPWVNPVKENIQLSSQAVKKHQDLEAIADHAVFSAILRNYSIAAEPKTRDSADNYLPRLQVEVRKVCSNQLKKMIQQFGIWSKGAGFSRKKFPRPTDLQRFQLNAQKILNKAKTILEKDYTSLHCDRLLTELNAFRAQLLSLDPKIRKNARVQALLSQSQKIIQEQSDLKVIQDFPKMAADGLARDHIMARSPKAAHLELEKAGWFDKQRRLPLADIVFVGGGPAAIAGAYYASASGMRTILMDQYVAQSFSDAGAYSVKWMRTNGISSTLALPGIAPPEHVASIGYPAVSAKGNFKEKAETARRQLLEATGQGFTGLSSTFSPEGDPMDPISRGELFQYLIDVAEQVNDHPNGKVLEQFPVQSCIRTKDGLYLVTAENGFKTLARRLVIATGMVGSDSENLAIPPIVSRLIDNAPNQYLSLNNHQDLASPQGIQDCLELDTESRTVSHATAVKASSHRQLICAEPLLGMPQVQQYLLDLPEGSRIGIIGSGESAYKAAILIRDRNPGLNVDIFVKQRLEPAQLQIPGYNTIPDVMKQGIFSEKAGAQTIKEWRDTFGTPVTPQTCLDVLNQVSEGKIRIFELGRYVDDDSIVFKTGVVTDPETGRKRTVTRLYTDNHDVVKSLENEYRELTAAGIYTEPLAVPSPTDGYLLAEIDGALVIASGYNRKQVQEHPLLVQLRDQGLLEQSKPEAGRKGSGEYRYDAKNRLTSSKDPNLALLGAVNMNGTASDSAIPGMSSRAFYLVEHMRDSLKREAQNVKKSRHATKPEKEKAIRLAELAPSRIPDNIAPNQPLEIPVPPLPPDIIAAAQAIAKLHSGKIENLFTFFQEGFRRFPGDKLMRELWMQAQVAGKDSLTGEQRLLLARAEGLFQRMKALRAPK